jgi:hypothetical protein
MAIKKFFVGLTVLLSVSLFVLGCPADPDDDDPVTGPVDNSAAGQMVAATANAVFGAKGTGWDDYDSGVEIIGFKSASALGSYLEKGGVSLQIYLALAGSGSGTATFAINTINGKPVVKIRAEAFKPDTTDPDTFISKVVAEVRLPATITELGADVFSGVDAKVVIPKAVIENIITTAKANEEIDTDDATDDAILQTLLGKTVTIAKADENGTVDKADDISPTAPPDHPPTLGGSNALVLEADSADALATHITTAKNADNANKTVIIKLTQTFYTDAADDTSFIAIDADATDNSKPYTILGLGIGDDDPELPVGILIANDNITLAFVKVNVETTSKAAPCSWDDYKAAVSIGRYASSALLTGENLPCENVTVQNCVITNTANASSFTAGIYVCGTTGTDVIYPSKNITISDNIITATGHGGSAVQAVNIAYWHPSVAITGNTITASYGTAHTSAVYLGGAPASAIYVGRVLPATVTGMDNTAVSISNNTLVSDVYSFYFNAFKTVANPTDAVGVDALRTDNFSVAETTWALPTANDQTSTYKKLFNALKANITGYGFAYVGEAVYISNSVAFEVEQYEIQAGAVFAVSVYGDHIANDAYSGDSTANAFSGSGSVGYDYGRKLANDPNNYNIENNKFCYGPASDKVSTDDFTTPNNYAYDTDLTP